MKHPLYARPPSHLGRDEAETLVVDTPLIKPKPKGKRSTAQPRLCAHCRDGRHNCVSRNCICKECWR